MNSQVPSNKIEVSLITPTKILSHVTCDNAFIPTSTGIIEVLPHHTALVTEISAGVFHYTLGNKSEFFSIAGGIAYVADNKVTLLADVAEDASSLDLSRAQKALERAKRRLSGAKEHEAEAHIDVARAMSAERRAQARLEAIQARTSKS